MRAEILLWSTFSGAVLGLFTGVGLLALGTLASAALPAPWLRHLERLLPLALAATLVVCPLIGAVLGFLEGRLKLK